MLVQGSENALFCECCCFHLRPPYRRVCKTHFCLYPSVLLEITKIQNKYMNDMMKKTYEDLERWDGLFKISKMYLKLYWFVAFPSLWCLLICHSFSQMEVSYLFPEGLQLSLPVQLWAGTQLWDDDEHFSHHSVTQNTVMPNLLSSLLVSLNPYLPQLPALERNTSTLTTPKPCRRRWWPGQVGKLR